MQHNDLTRTEYHLSQAFLAFFQERVEAGKRLALISVLATTGSTYSKAGMQMLVDEDRLAQGMLSGGCLEGDLAERVADALGKGEATVVTYDLTEDDRVFGLGVGCEGTIRASIQPLLPEHGYEPLTEWLQQLAAAGFVDIDDSQAALRIVRPRSLLVLGAGKDAEPLIEFSQVLGWRTTVYDHRPAYLESPGIQAAEVAQCGEARELATALDLPNIDAAIVMSHNLTADVAYLQALADSDIGFIGLIGPPKRRDLVLAELGATANILTARLHAPVGTQIGGRGPAAIALEIVAELQAYFSSPNC